MNRITDPGETLVSQLADGILAGQRRALAKAITLIEDTRPEQRRMANALVSRLMPHSGRSIRVGISGVPGVGKSTFLEALGMYLIGLGHRVGILAIDPSSRISGGSIMGDKVRMERLAREANAFIRPSPTSGSLGGVHRRTRESLLLCEAFGMDLLLIETVGVGQSEVTVSEMVDFFLVLMLPGAGDEMQGIKKGILEMADALVINKADGEFTGAAERARRDYQSALQLLRPKTPGWAVPVLTMSALEARGISEVWGKVLEHQQLLIASGQLAQLRRRQVHDWFHAALRDGLLERLYQNCETAARIESALAQLDAQARSPYEAADEILALFLHQIAPKFPEVSPWIS